MRPRKVRRNTPVKKSKGGRVCKKFGCKQRLSVYNAQEYCHAHQSEFLNG